MNEKAEARSAWLRSRGRDSTAEPLTPERIAWLRRRAQDSTPPQHQSPRQKEEFEMDENAQAIGRIQGSERLVYECPTCFALVVNMGEHEFAVHVV